MYINKFESWLKEKGKSHSTLRAYRNVLDSFSSWYQEHMGRPFDPQQVISSQLQDYIRYIESIQKPATVQQKLVAIKTYWRFMNEQGLVTTNPIQSITIKQTEGDKNSLRWLIEDEMSRLVDQIGNTKNEWHRKRNLGIVLMMLKGGLRISEVVNLRMDDLKWKDSILKIHTGEGEQHRSITMDQHVTNQISHWISIRNEVTLPFVFVSQKRKQMDPRSVRYVLDSYFKKAGIVDASPSSLRHTFARSLVVNGESYESIAYVLGLESMLGVRRYCKELIG